ncbi:hypothetical protein [Streptomyces sp. NBC_01530]|uniref:hypothetical protein n=1 Tax=Streptomyces sp. NBC_01530 TaxID=2903895 RepID=UPI003865BD85
MIGGPDRPTGGSGAPDGVDLARVSEAKPAPMRARTRQTYRHQRYSPCGSQGR